MSAPVEANKTLWAKRIKRMSWLILSIIILVYFLIVAGVYFMQEKMLFFPASTPEGNQKHYKDIEWETEVEGIELKGWLLNKGRKKLMIYYGGNAEELSYLITEFKGFQNFSVLLVNYRGYGQSGGKPSQKALFKDALSIYDQVSTEYEKVVVVGRSLGSGVASYVASERDVSAVGLITPYSSIKEVGQKTLPIVPVGLILRHPFNSVEYAKKVTVPALFIIAGKDEIIPKDSSQKLYDAWGGEKEWLEIEWHTHNSFSISWIL